MLMISFGEREKVWLANKAGMGAELLNLGVGLVMVGGW